MTTSNPTQERPLLGLRRQPGRLALAVMRLPLKAYRHDKGHLLGQTFVEFDHLGRKSGRTYQAVAMVLGYDKATGEAVIMRAWDTDWYRNLQAHPATRVRLGRDSFTPEQRFLTDDEAFLVVRDFRSAHPHRVHLASRIIGWGDLDDDDNLRAFVHEHPCIAFRPQTYG